MLRLLAFYDDQQLDRQFVLATGESKVLGRGETADFRTDWDAQISRMHVRLETTNHTTQVTRLNDSANPVFIDGNEIQTSELRSGQSFVIGDSRFELRQVTQSDSPRSSDGQQLAIDRRQLQNIRYEDADKRIEVLTSLPAVIRESGVERDLHIALLGLLLAGIRHADGAAVVGIDENSKSRVLHQERRFETNGLLQPSTRMIHNAINQQKSILHVWDDTESTQSATPYTQQAEFNWAFCTPVYSDVVQNRVFYLAGRSPLTSARTNREHLHADIKFTEFIAEIVGSLQRQQELERQQAGLRQFFSPPVLEAVGSDLDTSLLEPRECDVTVLFCDLRGFSHRAEEQADNLMGLLERVSLALEVMTSQILRFGGVTGDFQGDAALGFWGWPISTDESPLNACRAALAIRSEFEKARADPQHPLTDFETSVGIAHGRAVAGKIGTREQVKVTVFGPVVNLASRLEGMTRELHVPILIDQHLDQMVRTQLSPREGRVRRLLRLLPYGMDRPLMVSELVPPESLLPSLTQQHLDDFERGVDAFIQGDWDSAWSCLHRMPPEDRAQDYLAMQITQHNRNAPANWDGIVRNLKKSG
ncbi:MAG: adenylate/guanylate cyclase domain-containing protein [Fuerstiella sp.]|nr:adenylate/guanylate cyclase domain-containing protein [Fuerstiella sp.]